MIFTPHILIGAALGAKLGLIGSLLALIFHFLLDFLPHYDYNVSALKEKKLNRRWLIALSKIALDLLFGLGLVAAVIRDHPNLNMAILGIFAALLPDGLLFLYWRKKDSLILRRINTFHHYCHWPEKKSGLLGLVVEIAVIAAAFFALTLV